MVWLTLQTVKRVVCEHTGPDWLLIQHQRQRTNQNDLAQAMLCWEVELGVPQQLHVPFNVGKEL